MSPQGAVICLALLSLACSASAEGGSRKLLASYKSTASQSGGKQSASNYANGYGQVNQVNALQKSTTLGNNPTATNGAAIGQTNKDAPKDNSGQINQGNNVQTATAAGTGQATALNYGYINQKNVNGGQQDNVANINQKATASGDSATADSTGLVVQNNTGGTQQGNNANVKSESSATGKSGPATATSSATILSSNNPGRR